MPDNKMWTKSKTLVLTWVLASGLFNSVLPACDSGWFGSACQYKCRCSNNNCDDNGNCVGGRTCVNGWFGPACQYVNLATNGISDHRSLTDNNEATCIDDVDLQEVKFSLTRPQPFTWMRIQFKDPDQIPNFHLKFKPHDNDSIIHCENLKNASVTKTSMDIHCDLDVAVDEVIMTGDGFQSLCSVYISGGRNIALRQNTTQSSIVSLITDISERAVDGAISRQSCTHTNATIDTSPNWNLTFTQPQLVNRYVIYNSLPFARLDGFILQSFTETGSRVFYYRDNETNVQRVYFVTSASVKQPISHVMIQATYMYQPDKILLSLCEVEIFGDSACPDGKYGFECQKTCNCAKKDKTCFVSTGLCPSGCAPGFYGENCDIECPNGKYGLGCLQDCSVYCISNFTKKTPVCSNDKGHCLQGCIDGFQGDTCATVKQDDVSGLHAGIGVLCVLLLIAIIVIIILGLWLRKEKKSRGAESQTSAGCNNAAVNLENDLENSPNYIPMFDDDNDYEQPINYDMVQGSKTTQGSLRENPKHDETKDTETNVYENEDGPQIAQPAKDTVSLEVTKRKEGGRQSDYENQPGDNRKSDYENQWDVMETMNVMNKGEATQM